MTARCLAEEAFLVDIDADAYTLVLWEGIIMRKEIGVLLTGALCFDLGVVLLPSASQAQNAIYMKFSDADVRHELIVMKLNKGDLKAEKACLDGKGTLGENKGQGYCRRPEPEGRRAEPKR